MYAGSGKTALAHLLATGKPCKSALRPTVGCNTTVILVDLNLHGDSQQQQQAFIELWDVGAHMHAVQRSGWTCACCLRLYDAAVFTVACAIPASRWGYQCLHARSCKIHWCSCDGCDM